MSAKAGGGLSRAGGRIPSAPLAGSNPAAPLRFVPQTGHYPIRKELPKITGQPFDPHF